MSAAITFVLDSTTAQLIPSVDSYAEMTFPVRTRRTQELGRTLWSVSRAELFESVVPRSCQRKIASGERPIKSYFEPVVRLSRIMTPTQLGVEAVWTAAIWAVI